MPQSLARVLVHLVFSTKNREPTITLPHQTEMFSYLAGTLQALTCPTLLVGGMPDHVHLLFGLNRTMALSQVVEELKKESSRWAKTKVHPEFYWQNGYGAFSVSASNLEAVRGYIANQKQHHERRSFQDEFRLLLEKHGIERDERYLWD